LKKMRLAFCKNGVKRTNDAEEIGVNSIAVTG